ncbi:RNA polymerase sigma factor [Curtobacterium ammoniigenes]|uniref:RNA polymerase sigma factor n=1 Tax=Curtobacterium ammoniigenes TaxID=395387 RepID=UPI000AD03E02|nr:sigma-70 family RNA polymerase sigma factor [Curtobacterium ammoniigenes]
MRARAKATDESSEASLFSDAYREFAPGVRGYLHARGLPDPEAVTHDVFIALHERIGTVTGGRAGLKTLIYTIAHARCVDHYRQRARGPAFEPYEPDNETRLVPSAEDIVMTHGFGSNVLPLLDSLSAEQREVIALRVIADLSLEDTAAVMDRSVGAVKQLQRRALVSLRQRVENAGHIDLVPATQLGVGKVAMS